MVQDAISSAESSVTLQGSTAQSNATTPSTIRSDAAPADTMASSSADNSPSGQADGAQQPPRAATAAEGAFRGPETPEPPDPDGRDVRLMRMFNQQMEIMQQQMKADEDDTIDAVLDDLRDSIRESVQAHSARRLAPLMRIFGSAIVENLGYARDNFVKAEMHREMEREIRAELEVEFAARRELDLVHLRRELVPEIRAQVEAEIDGRREEKLAELAEIDAEIDRKKRASFMAPPVTVKNEQDDQPSRPVRIKKEPNDEPSSLFLEWDDQNHQNGGNRDNNQEIKQDIKQEDVGPSGIMDDSVIPWPYPDDPDDLTGDELRQSLREFGYHTPRNYSETPQSDDRLSPLSPSQGWTEKDDNRAYRRLKGLSTDGEDSDMEHIASMFRGASPIWSSNSSQAEDNYAGQEDVGRDLGSGNSGGSTNYSIPEDDASSDQEHLRRNTAFGVPGESLNYSRQQEDISSGQEHLEGDLIIESIESSNHDLQEGDTFNSQTDYSTNSPGTPIKTESLYPSDDADDERPASKARKSNSTRGTKRKPGRAVFDDPRFHCIENGQIKRAKINDRGHFKSNVDRDTSFFDMGGLPDLQANNFNSARLGDYDYHKYLESINNTEALSASGSEKDQAGRIKRPMPKKRHLSRGSPIQYQEEEEDDEL